jgi:hypothetical protein
MSKRLSVLTQSLSKKQALFDNKLSDHFSTVKATNGQPLNDKRNGQATLNKWNRQNESLRALDQGIQKTVDAIAREEGRIALVDIANESMPPEITELVANGTLSQWRKHPTTFFVVGVEKARIVWNGEKKIVAHRYVGEIKDRDQHRKFASVFNELKRNITTAGAQS